jgi:CRP-like cAMP-binding protein
MPKNLVIDYFNSIYPLSKVLTSYLSEKLKIVAFKKGRYLVSPLDKEDLLFFLVEGAVRGFTRIGDKKITTWLEVENNWVGRIRDFDCPGVTEYIEALEDCKLIYIDKKTLHHIYDNYMEVNYIARIVIEKSYSAAEERAFIARLPSAKLKYIRFLEIYPHLIERIPIKHIASFLGISEETLSRVRTGMLKEKHSDFQ